MSISLCVSLLFLTRQHSVHRPAARKTLRGLICEASAESCRRPPTLLTKQPRGCHVGVSSVLDRLAKACAVDRHRDEPAVDRNSDHILLGSTAVSTPKLSLSGPWLGGAHRARDGNLRALARNAAIQRPPTRPIGLSIERPAPAPSTDLRTRASLRGGTPAPREFARLASRTRRIQLRILGVMKPRVVRNASKPCSFGFLR